MSASIVTGLAPAAAPRRRHGFWKTIVGWAEIFRASMAVSHAWEAGRRADPRDLAIFGVSPETEARLLSGAGARIGH